jgi:hypothetical protein
LEGEELRILNSQALKKLNLDSSSLTAQFFKRSVMVPIEENIKKHNTDVV